MINYLQALEIVFAHLPPRKIKRINIKDAGSYFLAEDITADIDLPTFNNSAMDGYAVRAADTKNASSQNMVHLKLIADIPAGSVFDGKIEPGQAASISTGAQIPIGADAVIPVEFTEKKSSQSIALLCSVDSGAHIRLAGEEVKSGSQIFKMNDLINFARTGLLASFGREDISVFEKPTVGFLATGNELVEMNRQPGRGQIRNSNSIMIRNMCHTLGISFIDFGIAGDSEESIINHLENVNSPDILITSAGVSVGEHDVVGEALHKIGFEQHFWKTAIKPGKPLMFGSRDRTLFFGLPGNPVSGAVMFMQFIEPVIHHLAGSEAPFRAIIEANALSNFRGTAGRLHFARSISFFDRGWQVKSAGTQGSHILSSLAEANSFMLIPPDQSVSAGETVLIQNFVGLQVGFAEFMQSIAGLLK
jgi:molybdopterin molybdotransferase